MDLLLSLVINLGLGIRNSTVPHLSRYHRSMVQSLTVAPINEIKRALFSSPTRQAILERRVRLKGAHGNRNVQSLALRMHCLVIMRLTEEK